MDTYPVTRTMEPTLAPPIWWHMLLPASLTVNFLSYRHGAFVLVTKLCLILLRPYLCLELYVLSCFSCAQPCVTPWTIPCQAPLSERFSRQEYWSGLSCPPPGDLPDPGIKHATLIGFPLTESPALEGGFFTTSATWEPPEKMLNGVDAQ